MKKILILTVVTLLLLLPSCGGNMTIKSDNDAASYSQQYKKIVLFNGIIYKNGDRYGKYEITNTDPTDEIVTYENLDGTVVATMELKGVSPQKAVLNLSDGIAVTLKMREMEIDVNKEDGAIYLIKDMILTKELENKKIKVNTKELKHEQKEVNNNLEAKNTNIKTNVKITTLKEANLDLRYNFKVGQKLHYKSIDNTRIKISMDNGMTGIDMGAMPMGNMAITNKFMTETDFNLNIISVNPNKSANFEIIINSFKVYSMPNKKLIASDTQMKDLKVNGIITDKGIVKFYNDLFLVKTKNGKTMLVSISANKKGENLSTSGSAEVDGEKVEIEASFNPRTGNLSSSAKIRKIKKSSKKTVIVKKDDNKIEILPKNLMGLFLLPKNKISLNQTINFSAPMMNIKFNAQKGDKPACIKLTSNFITNKNNVPKEMSKDMLAMQPRIDAKVNAKFNYKKGCLKSINGIINNNMNMQGIRIDIHSEVQMKKLK